MHISSTSVYACFSSFVFTSTIVTYYCWWIYSRQLTAFDLKLGLWTLYTNKFTTTTTRWYLLCKIPHIHKICYYMCFVAWLERCLLGWICWLMLVSDGGNMWFHYLWPCWEGQKHWSNLRECRREYRNYYGYSWYLCVLLYVANVLIVSSQLNSMTFGFVLEIGCW